MYGEFNDVGSNWTGTVFGYRMTEFNLNEKGSLEVIFTKNNINLRCWFNKIEKAEDETEEEFKKARTRLSRVINSLVLQYLSIAELKSKVKPTETFEDYIEQLRSALPSDFSEKEGYLVVGYNQNGYLQIPSYLQWEAESKRWLPFFSIKETTMRDLGKLSLTKPSQVEVADEEELDDLF